MRYELPQVNLWTSDDTYRRTTHFFTQQQNGPLLLFGTTFLRSDKLTVYTAWRAFSCQAPRYHDYRRCCGVRYNRSTTPPAMPTFIAGYPVCYNIRQWRFSMEHTKKVFLSGADVRICSSRL